MTIYLSLDNLLAMVDQAGLQTVRDFGLLDSAPQSPRSRAFGETPIRLVTRRLPCFSNRSCATKP